MDQDLEIASLLGRLSLKEQLSPSALALLSVISVLDEGKIPEELLTTAALRVDLPNYPYRQQQYLEARDELIQTSLVARNTETNELSTRPEYQAVIREKMEKTDLHAVIEAVAILISAVWPWLYATESHLPRHFRPLIAERLAPHVRRLGEICGDEIRRESWNGTTELGCVFTSFAWYMFRCDFPSQSKIFANLAATILTKAKHRVTQPTEQERIADCLDDAQRNLALVACLNGRYDYINDRKIRVEIQAYSKRQMNKNPGDKLAQAEAYHHLGVCATASRKMDKAIGLFENSLRAYGELESARLLSGTYTAVYLCLLHVIRGQPDKGEEVLKPTLEKHEEIVGTEDTIYPESGHIWRAMGNVRRAQHRHDEAFHCHVRALGNYLVTVGDSDYFTRDYCYGVALDLIELGKPVTAVEYLGAAIKAFTSTDKHERQAARVFWKKGCLLRDMGKYTASLEPFQKAMELRKKMTPTDHRSLNELTDDDWSKWILYWSR